MSTTVKHKKSLGAPPTGSRAARVPSAKKPTPSGRSARSRKGGLSDTIERFLKVKKRPGLAEMNHWMMSAWNLENANDHVLDRLHSALAARSGAKQSGVSPTERKRATKGSGRKAATPKKKK